MINLQFKSK